MKRIKRHKVKTEAPESSISQNREQEVHDLAYYIHDRVELMHQVFSVIKYKELKAMVPASISNISLDDLQELCTEELLGISSKRLCAILDGAEPPSDTESSSPSPPPEQMETISLDSISSDDEILSQASSKKKKHKHRRHTKSKSKRKKSIDKDEGESDRNKASRAGLTVLELLELQARARAIRAQLQQEQKPVSETTTKEPPHSSDNEVEIKEEPAEVVEISSDEEKPKVEELQEKIREVQATTPLEKVTPQTTVTKKINELVITVPPTTKQKIRLKRNKSVTAATESVTAATETSSVSTTEKPKYTSSVATTEKNKASPTVATNKISTDKLIDGNKKPKPKKKKKDKKIRKDDIDNDEITLQLSDTEKMDLLEDLDRKHYDSVSSESSSESSSDSDVSDKEKDKRSAVKAKDDIKRKDRDGTTDKEDKKEQKVALEAEEVVVETDKDSDADKKTEDDPEKVSSETVTEDGTKKSESQSSEVDNTEDKEEKIESDDTVQINKNTEINVEPASEIVGTTDSNVTIKDNVADNSDLIKEDTPPVVTKDKETADAKDSEKNMSEGELSDRESSEIEAVDLKPEVVCISDDEGDQKAKKKKKKKDKKSKKEKKTKKKSDFRESADQNFYNENFKIGDPSQEEIQSQAPIEVIDNQLETLSKPSPTINKVLTEIIDKVDLTAEKTIDEDIKPLTDEIIIDKYVKTVSGDRETQSDSDIEAVYEIMELSDDSSCCEVECAILSKEPTASEIEALSAKIDEIERVEIITDKEIREYEEKREDIENISWKDRYLDSTKVKKVLTTANILNALRKKNIELKKKLAESKVETEDTVAEEKEVQEENVLEEGSIEQFNTLEALTTYVDPVVELPKDLKKDAKLLLKMYKKLLKYNDMNKPDSEKKRKKKKKKIKKDTVNTEDGELRGNSDTMEKNSEVNLEVGEKSV